MIIALQTFTIKKLMEQDVSALITASNVGFTNFEIYHADLSPATLSKVKAIVDNNNIHVVNIQNTYGNLVKHFDDCVNYCKTLRCNHVTISVLPLMYRINTRRSIERMCNKFNALGKRFQAHGITLMYHTHNMEYVNHGSYRIIDVIKQKFTNNVKVVLDTYWATKAGVDVVDMMEYLGNTLNGVHLRDYIQTTVNGKVFTSDANYGTGILDLKGIIDKCIANNLFYIAVERKSTNPVADMKVCYDYLQKNGYLKE